MTKVVGILVALVVLSGCSKFAQKSDDATRSDEKAQARKAWANCLFELDKVEAIRGRNLDDLNLGGSVARNQFLVDCMATTEGNLTPELISEMGNYAAKKDRRAIEMSLNTGTRALPGDEPAPR